MSKNLISIEDAKNWTKNYQDNMKSGDAKAFLISCETIVDILKEMKVLQESKGVITLHDVQSSSIRAYLAVNPKQADANGQTLVMVGTMKDSTGVERDMVEGEIDAPFNKSDLNGSGAFDFSLPCPRHCDENSPLNHK
ncbi:hypothetical protein [Winogradskyella jejuensis]|uniref:Uncharacterized protein n=1 Tax=Winogradskyella jejuensis TaxID=1089305 RepID=A0A1M5M356_9FLAO|nr:hypothetical protein [Winogradskyella jejuensis]SHG71705.1 hypothetical protein SAMN05444148_0790 [Winogradskyella jejuensis]